MPTVVLSLDCSSVSCTIAATAIAAAAPIAQRPASFEGSVEGFVVMAGMLPGRRRRVVGAGSRPRTTWG